MDVRPLAERADARELDLEGPAAHGRKLGVEVAGDVLADLAEEPQRHMQGVQRTPAGALHPRLAAGERQADVARDRQGGEEPDHDPT